jgi:PhzF family phenazine biosynthesis protein
MRGVLALRHEVFCVEQGVPEDLERDALDATALHLAALDADGVVVGTCRLVQEGATWRLGRMAVAGPLRSRGIGALLLDLAHDEAARAGAATMELHAQRAARRFYHRAGYVAHGPEFTEAGMPHVAMSRRLGPPAPTAVPLLQVDAFADAPFTGNPAAVCLLERPADPAWMQSVAAEMNLSETAFPVPAGDAFGLRWFTPVTEVALCGHATLASAHVLWETGRVADGEPIAFDSAGGRLTATRDGGWIVLDFPATPAREEPAPPELVAALGVTPRWTGRTVHDWLVQVEHPEEVRACRPDMGALAAAPARGVILTAPGGRDGVDVTSRFFGPAAGIPEDPVTGSAHCAIGPFWAERLGRDDLVCHQASARGGIVRVGVRGGRVLLGGRAVTVLTGTLTAPA